MKSQKADGSNARQASYEQRSGSKKWSMHNARFHTLSLREVVIKLLSREHVRLKNPSSSK